MQSKTRKWCFAVECECGKINVIATAPDEEPDVYLTTREVLCGCGKRAICRAEEIRRIRQP
jgi:hypothetical protein